MEKYFKRKTPSTSTSDDVTTQATKEKFKQPIDVSDLNNLPWDPVDRPRISQYNVNQRDDIRRKYWNRGPCQPSGHDFKKIIIGNKTRRFVPSWFTLYGNWLEYSVKAEKAFCLCCYLFRDDFGRQGGNEAFVSEGFNGWNKTERFVSHVGDFKSFHNRALKKCEDLMRPKQSISFAFSKLTKQEKEDYRIRLLEFRLNGFVPLLVTISSFCIKHNIQVVNMEDAYVSPNGRKRRVNISNQRFFEIECFNTVVDMQIQEFNDRFSEASTELLSNMACLNPRDSFSQFNTSKLVRLSYLYPKDFSAVERMELESQLNLYYANVTKDDSFIDLNGITDLAIMMVKKRKHISYPLVYRLLKLALVLPVATASVERSFSAMKIIKSNLRNRISQRFLNSCVICGVEREALANVSDEDVMKRFQKMTDRKGHL